MPKPQIQITQIQAKPPIPHPRKSNGHLSFRHVNSSPYSQPLVSKYNQVESGPRKSYSTSNILDEKKTIIFPRRKQSAPTTSSSLENVLQSSKSTASSTYHHPQNPKASLDTKQSNIIGIHKSVKSNTSSKILKKNSTADSDCQLISFDVCENPEMLCQDIPQDDKELLMKTDNLFTDVAKLCKEMGFGDTDINQVIVKESYLDDSHLEKISSVPCPSLINSPSPTPRSSRQSKSEEKLSSISRPVSASTEKYNLILSTLRHIEDEEQKTSIDNLNKASHYLSNSSINSASQQRPISSASLGSIFSLTPTTTPRPGTLDSEVDNSGVFNNSSKSARYSSSTAKFVPDLKISLPKSARSSTGSNVELANSVHSSKPNSQNYMRYETSDETARNIYSFLDEVEKCDRQTLFSLKYDIGAHDDLNSNSNTQNNYGSSRAVDKKNGKMSDHSGQTLDSLIKKGSVELAREIIILQRKLDDCTHNIRVLEDTLLNQRELNIRNLKNSEKDLKKRLTIQQEEFELALSRHQSFVDQLIAEKRALHDKCEKVLKESKDSEEKHQQQIKSLQEKHLEELKRVRKIQEAAEKTRKQKWVGQKTQELKELTVKGLEPELQSIIQRHQREMAETRAYYTDEIAEIEQRYARKQTHQLQELREAFNREKEDAIRRERDLVQKRHETDLQRLEKEFDALRKRLKDEFQDEKDKIMAGEIKLRNELQENIRKTQMKCELEMQNQKQEYEQQIANLERKHENEISSLKDVYEANRDSWIENFTKKQDLQYLTKQNELIEKFNKEKEIEFKEREKKLREEFEVIRSEQGIAQETRFKRLQEKFQAELEEFESAERELKQKFSKMKNEVLEKDEEIFALKSSLNLKEKQVNDLTESNMKMMEERVNLTSIIRREFTSQIEALEEDCRNVKGAVVELKAKHKLELESHKVEMDTLRNDKESEMEKIGVRVKQALTRKEETIQELRNQMEKYMIQIEHLEEILEQQRKDFVQSITGTSNSNKNSTGGPCKKK